MVYYDKGKEVKVKSEVKSDSRVAIREGTRVDTQDVHYTSSAPSGASSGT